MKTKTFYITGGKWFDKVNGNTYHNAKITDENGVSYYSGFSYGYGSQYLESAREYIENTLKVKKYNIIDAGSFYTLKRNIKNGAF